MLFIVPGVIALPVVGFILLISVSISLSMKPKKLFPCSLTGLKYSSKYFLITAFDNGKPLITRLSTNF